MANTQAITDLLKRATDAGDVPGVVVAAATAEGPIFAGGSGVRDTTSGAPMTADTVVWIASMTKAVTGACAMQLVEQGRLSLDGPIATVLPELGKVQVLEGFAADGSPRLRPARRPITLRHLLTHTSGFVYDIWNPEMGRYLEATGTPGIISCANAALSIPLVFDPGERWDYGIGIDWAGKAVEAVSGQRLGAYMQQNLLQPLGMADTGFKIGPAQRQRLAKVHNRTPEGFVATDIGAAAGARIRNGRRRPVFDRRRLSSLHAHDPERRNARRHTRAGARDGRHDVGERDGRSGLPRAEDGGTALLQRCRFHRRHEVGAELPDQSPADADGPFGWVARLGRVGELLLLDRPGEAGDRRLCDAAICRSSTRRPCACSRISRLRCTGCH